MKRFAPFLLLALAGTALMAWLLPWYATPLPAEISITRAQAREIGDRAAREYGIPVDDAWPLVTWEQSNILEPVLGDDPGLRRRAAADPVLAPRLAGWRVTYFRRGESKNPPYGFALVSPTGELAGVRRTPKSEEKAPTSSLEQVRASSDEFVRQTTFAGAPDPVFDNAREFTLAGRTDRTLRYTVNASIPTPGVSTLLAVFYAGSERLGWMLLEESADGSQFQFDAISEITSTFSSFATIFGMLLVLVVIFLRKYHAGEVGVETAIVLFGVAIGLGLIVTTVTTPEMSSGTQFGGASAPVTAVMMGLFRTLFLDVPIALVVFVGWAVSESFARERWGHRLASFDAVIRRDPVNADVGRSLIQGLLAAPVLAGAAWFSGWLGIQFTAARPDLGSETLLFLGTRGGAVGVVLGSMLMALVLSIPVILFFLASFHRRRMLGVGIVLALVIGVLMGSLHPAIGPVMMRFLFAWGGIAAAIAVFMLGDLLTAGVAILVASLLMTFVPYLTVASGDAATPAWMGLLIVPALALLTGAAGLATRRRIVYSYDDLAPHVRRIIERERIKAEIDAANRIQAALLPAEEPRLTRATVASHYRAASEIGGDYFDFLPLPDGRMGIAFGDVAGHGLTSGIIMSMAKSALLVQIGYDSSPQSVMRVLNDIVIRTAPRRMLMTFFYAVLDSEGRSMEFASAGHLDPYVWRAASKSLEPLSSWGFPLGVKRQGEFRQHKVSFAAGDRLVLYSDGFIEALDDDGDPFGFDRFESTIAASGHRGAEEIRRALLDAVRKFTRNRPPEDDQTLVVISFDAPDAVRMSA